MNYSELVSAYDKRPTRPLTVKVVIGIANKAYEYRPVFAIEEVKLDDLLCHYADEAILPALKNMISERRWECRSVSSVEVLDYDFDPARFNAGLQAFHEDAHRRWLASL